MIRHTNDAISDRQGGRVAMVQRDHLKFLGQREGGDVLAGVGVVNPEFPQCSQLLFGVAEAFGEAERRGAGLPGRRNRALGKQQRRAQSGPQLHLGAGLDRRLRCQRRQYQFNAGTAFVDHWQPQPERDRRDGQRHAERMNAVRRKRPIERRPQIVDFLGIVGQPFVTWPRRRFTVRALEQLTVILGVTARDQFAARRSRRASRAQRRVSCRAAGTVVRCR